MTPEPARAGRRPWSLWAVASLVTTAVACPPFCLIGPILGFVAIADLHRHDRRGRGLALAGIALGLVLCGGWIALGRFWHVHVRTPMLAGPRPALTAGMNGDVAAFRAAFHHDPGDDEARAFLAVLRERYGTLRDIAPLVVEDAPPVGPGDVDVAAPVITYRLSFDRADVAAEARFLTWSDGGLPMILRWDWLALRDPDRGDLSYPVDRGSLSAAPKSLDVADPDSGDDSDP